MFVITLTYTQPLEEMPQRHLKAFFDMADAENTFMFTSDWPHFDYDEPSAVADLRIGKPLQDCLTALVWLHYKINRRYSF